MTHSKDTTKKGGRVQPPPYTKIVDINGLTDEERMAAVVRVLRQQQLADRFDRLEAEIDRQEDRVAWLTDQWFNEIYNVEPTGDLTLDYQVNTARGARENFKTIFKSSLNNLIALLNDLVTEYAPSQDTRNSVDVVLANDDIEYYNNLLHQLDQPDQHSGTSNNNDVPTYQANCIGDDCIIAGGRKRKPKKAKKTKGAKKTKKAKKTKRANNRKTRSNKINGGDDEENIKKSLIRLKKELILHPTIK